MKEVNLLDGIKIVQNNIPKLTDKLLKDFYREVKTELLKRGYNLEEDKNV